MTRIAVFAYGSLVDPRERCADTRAPGPRSSPARLVGWRRRWSVCRDNLQVGEDLRDRPPRRRGPALHPRPQRRARRRGRARAGARTEPCSRSARPNWSASTCASCATTASRSPSRWRRRCASTRSSPSPPARSTTRPSRPAGAVILAPYLRTVEAAFDAIGRARRVPPHDRRAARAGRRARLQSATRSRPATRAPGDPNRRVCARGRRGITKCTLGAVRAVSRPAPSAAPRP